MATVVFTGRLAAVTGMQQTQIDGATVRELIRNLEARYPTLRGQLTEGMAVAIDGEIISAPLLEALEHDSEVHFIPAIEGG